MCDVLIEVVYTHFFEFPARHCGIVHPLCTVGTSVHCLAVEIYTAEIQSLKDKDIFC